MNCRPPHPHVLPPCKSDLTRCDPICEAQYAIFFPENSYDHITSSGKEEVRKTDYNGVKPSSQYEGEWVPAVKFENRWIGMDFMLDILSERRFVHKQKIASPVTICSHKHFLSLEFCAVCGRKIVNGYAQ